MKPNIHANSSVKKWGGIADDYIEIHEWFDQTKAHFGDNRHRAILHNSFGIFLCEQTFGRTITNSDKKIVSVRDIGEQHCIEDIGHIPTVGDYLCEMNIRDWMCGNKKDYPESRKAMRKADEAKKLPILIPIEDTDWSKFPVSPRLPLDVPLRLPKHPFDSSYQILD